VWIVIIWLRIGANGGILWTFNESSGIKKGGKFLDQLREYQFFKKDCAVWSLLVQT
jgi:hypothetical protein